MVGACRRRETLLAEVLKTREGWHLFLYPSPAATCTWGWPACWRGALAQHVPRTFSIAVNDYGFELLSATRGRLARAAAAGLRAGHDAAGRHRDHDADRCCTRCWKASTRSELAQRRFREIARVLGPDLPGLPGEKRSNKQLQASSSLFTEVFRKYDPASKLLLQAEQELLAQEPEIGRLQREPRA